jgi:hypothetical protein
MLIPKIGNKFYHDGVFWTVLYIGNGVFKHESPNGIFSLVNIDEMVCIVVLFRDKTVKITLDPSIPSLKADGKELLTEYGIKNGMYALLKYERCNN